MRRTLLAVALALLTSACAYRPQPSEQIRIVDSPADVSVCTRLGEVSPTVPTGPSFDDALESMLHGVIALGGTDLYVSRRSADWALVRGIAYRCGAGVQVRGRVVTVVRAKG